MPTLLERIEFIDPTFHTALHADMDDWSPEMQRLMLSALIGAHVSALAGIELDDEKHELLNRLAQDYRKAVERCTRDILLRVKETLQDMRRDLHEIRRKEPPGDARVLIERYFDEASS